MKEQTRSKKAHSTLKYASGRRPRVDVAMASTVANPVAKGPKNKGLPRVTMAKDTSCRHLAFLGHFGHGEPWSPPPPIVLC